MHRTCLDRGCLRQRGRRLQWDNVRRLLVTVMMVIFMVMVGMSAMFVRHVGLRLLNVSRAAPAYIDRGQAAGGCWRFQRWEGQDRRMPI